MELLGIGIATFLIGGLAGYLGHRLYTAQIRRSAQKEAQDIIAEAQSELEILELDQKEQLQEIELELWTRDEAALLKLEEKIEEIRPYFPVIGIGTLAALAVVIGVWWYSSQQAQASASSWQRPCCTWPTGPRSPPPLPSWRS